MIYFYFLLWLAIAATTLAARSRRVVHILCGCYLTIHAVFIEQLLFGGEYLTTSGIFFTFDEAGTLFYILLAIVALFVFRHSEEYLKDDAIEHYRLYFSLLMLLTSAITGVYFANNIAITWILLEATTLCGAGILYYRRSK
ncbi:MAG: hydrogenase 4 subunit F, partial [Alistipes sp.]|nr:hydrogenase 4 subunit F [Alistipes sp.]